MLVVAMILLSLYYTAATSASPVPPIVCIL